MQREEISIEQYMGMLTERIKRDQVRCLSQCRSVARWGMGAVPLESTWIYLLVTPNTRIIYTAGGALLQQGAGQEAAGAARDEAHQNHGGGAGEPFFVHVQ